MFKKVRNLSVSIVALCFAYTNVSFSRVYFGVGGTYFRGFNDNLNRSNDTLFSASIADHVNLLGLDIRLGAETKSSGFYSALEMYGSFLFGLPNHSVGGLNVTNQSPAIFAGVALKIGGAGSEAKNKAYLIIASEYFTNIHNDILAGVPGKTGLLLVGGGLGAKFAISQRLDMFIEAKSMFDLLSHPAASTGSGYSLGHTGTVFFTTSLGFDFRF